MNNKKITTRPIRHYLYFHIVILTIVMLFIVVACVLPETDRVYKIILLITALFGLTIDIIAIIFSYSTQNYVDSFSEKGIERKKGELVIRELSWDEIENIVFYKLSVVNFILPIHHQIIFYPKNDKSGLYDFISYSNKKGIFITYISQKKLDELIKNYNLKIKQVKNFFKQYKQ